MNLMQERLCIINIGNELLLGRTVNTNLAWLGKELAAIGLPVSRSIIIQDSDAEIESVLRTAWRDNDILIMTGGLGPTDDDITKNAIAKFFRKGLEYRPEIWEQVHGIFRRRGIKTPLINKSQAMVPKDFSAYANELGTAPGLHYQKGGKHFFALPGVPREMKYLFSKYVKLELTNTFKNRPLSITTLHTWDISESELAEKLSQLKVPQGIQFAWLPQTGRVDLRIYGPDPDKVSSFEKKLRSMVDKNVWGQDEDTPQSVLHELLIAMDLTLGIAESCTGGYLGKLITDIPGSSQYFRGGVISYSNKMKISLLGVKADTIVKSSAVSKQTAAEMALGIRNKSKSDLGLAVTGIAGPEGGSKEKPVGTVWFGMSIGDRLTTKRVVFNGEREAVRLKAAEYVILMLIKALRSNS